MHSPDRNTQNGRTRGKEEKGKVSSLTRQAASSINAQIDPQSHKLGQKICSFTKRDNSTGSINKTVGVGCMNPTPPPPQSSSPSRKWGCEIHTNRDTTFSFLGVKQVNAAAADPACRQHQLHPNGRSLSVVRLTLARRSEDVGRSGVYYGVWTALE